MGRMTHSDPLGNDSHPWGQYRDLGLVRAFWDNTLQIITEPVAFFKKVDPDSPIGGAVLYGVLIASLGHLMLFIWQSFFRIGTPGPRYDLPAAAILLSSVVLVPLFVLLGIFLTAAILHLVLVGLGWSERPFGATVKVVSFAQVASLGNLIPLCGPLAGAVWGVILGVIGIRELHHQSTGRAVAVVLTPLLVLLACLVCFAGMVFVLSF